MINTIATYWPDYTVVTVSWQIRSFVQQCLPWGLERDTCCRGPLHNRCKHGGDWVSLSRCGPSSWPYQEFWVLLYHKDNLQHGAFTPTLTQLLFPRISTGRSQHFDCSYHDSTFNHVEGNQYNINCEHSLQDLQLSLTALPYPTIRSCGSDVEETRAYTHGRFHPFRVPCGDSCGSC